MLMPPFPLLPQLSYILILLTAIYIITVTPGQVFNLIGYLGILNVKNDTHRNVIRGILGGLKSLNSSTNIIVYTVLSRLVISGGVIVYPGT